VSAPLVNASHPSKVDALTALIIDVSGEYIRTDVREDQEGVPLYLDVAIYDVETCEPITDHWFEIWRKLIRRGPSLG
jgi:hypothetical protein